MAQPQFENSQVTGANRVPEFSDLSDFTVSRFLSFDSRFKKVVALGKFRQREGDAIVVLEKTPFQKLEFEFSDICTPQTVLKKVFQNGVNGVYICIPDEKLNINRFDVKVFYPVSTKDIEKHEVLPNYIIWESRESFLTVTRPACLERGINLNMLEDVIPQGVKGVLNNNINTGQGSDRIVLNKGDSTNGGFVLYHDSDDPEAISDPQELHLIAIVKNPEVKSLWDLDESHLPMLKNILEEGKKEVRQRYGIEESNLKIFVEYKPPFYRLRVHFIYSYLSHYDAPVERARHLDAIIEDIKMKPDFYKCAALPFLINKKDPLFEIYEQREGLGGHTQDELKRGGYEEAPADDDPVFDLSNCQHQLKVTNRNAKSKSMELEAHFNDLEGSANIVLENLPFSEADFKKICSKRFRLQNQRKSGNNCYNYTVYPGKECNEFRLQIVYPASKRHIQKNRIEPYHVINETPKLYEKISKPFIQKELQSSNEALQAVYNILEGRAEKHRIKENDDDPENGFVLVPDLKWHENDIHSLHLQAFVRNRELKTLRDLDESHLPLLRNILKKSTEKIMELYKLPQSGLRIFIHYLPSIYHFHVNFTSVQYKIPAAHADRSHLLEAVINNIEMVPDYYKRAFIPCSIKEQTYDESSLFSKYSKIGICKSVSPDGRTRNATHNRGRNHNQRYQGGGSFRGGRGRNQRSRPNRGRGGRGDFQNSHHSFRWV